MIITFENKPDAKIKRCGNGGIIRIDEDACVVIEEILKKIGQGHSVKEVASTLIKEVANSTIIKEGEPVDE